MTATIAIEARTETYHDLRGMVFDLVHSFSQRYRTPWDETLSVAHEGFLEAFEGYRPELASFATHASQKVRSKLFEWQRTTMRRTILGKIVDHNVELIPQDHFLLIDFLDELSEDAREVVCLALDAPRDIVHSLVVKGITPRNYKAAIREYLKDCGWCTARIAESFQEIAEALA